MQVIVRLVPCGSREFCGHALLNYTAVWFDLLIEAVYTPAFCSQDGGIGCTELYSVFNVNPNLELPLFHLTVRANLYMSIESAVDNIFCLL